MTSKKLLFKDFVSFSFVSKERQWDYPGQIPSESRNKEGHSMQHKLYRFDTMLMPCVIGAFFVIGEKYSLYLNRNKITKKATTLLSVSWLSLNSFNDSEVHSQKRIFHPLLNNK